MKKYKKINEKIRESMQANTFDEDYDVILEYAQNSHVSYHTLNLFIKANLNRKQRSIINKSGIQVPGAPPSNATPVPLRKPTSRPKRPPRPVMPKAKRPPKLENKTKVFSVPGPANKETSKPTKKPTNNAQNIPRNKTKKIPIKKTIAPGKNKEKSKATEKEKWWDYLLLIMVVLTIVMIIMVIMKLFVF